MDIVERLRKRHDFGCRLMDAPHTHECDCSYVDRHEAADEIERLRAEVAYLQKEIGECSGGYQTLEKEVDALKFACDALKKGQPDPDAAVRDENDRLRELLREAENKLRDWHTESREQAGGGWMCDFDFCRECGNRDFDPHRHDCRYVALVTNIDAALGAADTGKEGS